MQKRVGFPKAVLAINVFVGFMFSLVFLAVFASAELDLSINSRLDGSNGFDTDFYLQTDPSASTGFDSLDFEQQGFPSGNYSFLTSTVSGKNLIVDAFPSENNRTAYLVYRVNPAITGNLVLSWISNVFGYNYDSILTDYGSDSSYNSSVNSVNMKTSSSYSVSHSGAARYFSIGIRYFNFSCGDGTCNSDRGEDCSSCSSDCGACSGGGDGGGNGGGGDGGGGITEPPSCVDSSWDTVSIGSCSYGKKLITQSSNCGNTRTSEENCCEAKTISGDWSECTPQNTRTRNVQQISEDCTVLDRIETGSCTYQCSESWSCDWGSCQNGFIEPINCVDSKNCGTNDNRPSPISCTQEGNNTQVLLSGILQGEESFLRFSQNCSLNFVCEDWSACSVRSGIEDIKNAQGNLEGAKSRKCVDQNGCLLVPYYEQQKCSLKIFIEPKKEVICGEDYLSIYQQDTNYLLARIKDDRRTTGTFSMQFVLGGRAEEIPCAPKTYGEYTYTFFEKLMSYTNIRKLWGVLR